MGWNWQAPKTIRIKYCKEVVVLYIIIFRLNLSGQKTKWSHWAVVLCRLDWNSRYRFPDLSSQRWKPVQVNVTELPNYFNGFSNLFFLPFLTFSCNLKNDHKNCQRRCKKSVVLFGKRSKNILQQSNPSKVNEICFIVLQCWLN
jgi:hypothetical protein